MNKHSKEVSNFMKNSAFHHRPTQEKVVATFEDKYGEERVIRLTRSGLRVKNTASTVALALNTKVAEITSVRIKARRKELGLSLEQVCSLAGLASTTPKSRMWEIENNVAKGGLRFGTLYAIAIALKCSPTDLLPSIEDVLAGSAIATVTETKLTVQP